MREAVEVITLKLSGPTTAESNYVLSRALRKSSTSIRTSNIFIGCVGRKRFC